MRDQVWLSEELILSIHSRQIREHGHSDGIRDRGMLESALNRPRQRLVYGGGAVDLSALAGAYAYGIARNHPFVDGNKRTAAVACEIFLELNGHVLIADDERYYSVFMSLAAGEISEDELAAWLRDNSRPANVSERAGGYG